MSKYPTEEEMNVEHEREDAAAMAKHPAGYYWAFVLNGKGERSGPLVIAEHSEHNIWFIMGVDGSVLASEIEVIGECLSPPDV